jgi:hypothetical protein
MRIREAFQITTKKDAKAQAGRGSEDRFYRCFPYPSCPSAGAILAYSINYFTQTHTKILTRRYKMVQLILIKP